MAIAIERSTQRPSSQERVAAGERIERELLEGLALAVIAGTREGRIALAVLRAASDEECLSWALDLSEEVLRGSAGRDAGEAPEEAR